MTELKPCPFCGAELEYLFYTLDHNQGGKWGFAQCPCCGASAGEVRTSYDQSENAPWHEDALKEWNTRHIPEGYALVPIEPTKQILTAMVSNSGEDLEEMEEKYKAVIEVAREGV